MNLNKYMNNVSWLLRYIFLHQSESLLPYKLYNNMGSLLFRRQAAIESKQP